MNKRARLLKKQERKVDDVIRKAIKIIALLITTMILSGCTEGDLSAEDAFEYLARQIESENLYRYRLTIYYFSPPTFSFGSPSGIEGLRQSDYTTRVTVAGGWLQLLWRDSDFINRLNADSLVPVQSETEQSHFQLYYILETTRGRKIFDVAMFGNNRSIFVNGLEFEWNDVFYDIIRWHLPMEEVYRMDRLFGRYSDFWGR